MRQVLASIICVQSVAFASVPVRVASIVNPTDYAGVSSPRSIAVAPDGTVAAAWVAGPYPEGWLETGVSTDGGATFPFGSVAAVGVRHNSSIEIAVDDAGRMDLLWFTYDPLPTTKRFHHRRSPDRGQSWGAIHDFPSGEVVSSLTVAPNGLIALRANNKLATSSDGGATFIEHSSPGPVMTFTRDGILLACNPFNGVYCAASSDGGATFGPSQRVVSGSGSWYRAVLVPRGGTGAALAVELGPILSPTLVVAGTDDGGQNWSAPTTVATVRPNAILSADGTGATWALFRGQDNLMHLFSSTDLATWREVTQPPKAQAGCGREARSVGAIDGGVLLNADTVVWRSTNAGATWDASSAGAYRRPVGGVAQSRLASGRLVAVWSEVQGIPGTIRASVSDDDGARWSPARDVAVLRDTDFSAGRLLTTATVEGVVVAWVDFGSVVCREILSSRSADGELWEPAQPVDVSPLSKWGQSIAEDGAGRLVAMWTDGGSIPSPLHMTLSSDGGRSWTGSSTIQPVPGNAGISPSALVRAPDGALVVVAVHLAGDGHSAGDTRVHRSTDGGLSWSGEQILSSGYYAYEAALVAAGGRLVAASVGPCSAPAAYCDHGLFESYDSGVTWRELPLTRGNPNPPFGPPLLAGGFLGEVYFESGISSARSASVSLPVDTRFLLGPLPPMSATPSAESPWVFRLGLFYPEWETAAPPGVFYTQVDSLAPAIARDDTIRALQPRPDVASLFPLASYPVPAAWPGMNDPEDLVLNDESRPLVLYGVDAAGPNGLRVMRAAGSRVRLSW